MLDRFFKSEKPLPRLSLQPDPVFIIGMHRSGTSALGIALEHLGLTVGKTAMAPNPERGNPRGFSENLSLVQLHDRFLEAVRSSWLDCRPLLEKQFDGAPSRRFRAKLPQVLSEEFGQNRPLIKDPRMCRLMPLWLPVIREYFGRAHFILPIRHPVEVACSISKRDQLDIGLCLKLWVVHVLEGERRTRGLRRTITTYEQLIQSPIETVALLAGVLGLPADGAAVAATQIDPDLRHHQKPAWPAGTPHEELTLAIHQTLAARGPVQESVLDELREQYYREAGWKC